MGELEAAMLIKNRRKGRVGWGRLGLDPENMTSHQPLIFSGT